MGKTLKRYNEITKKWENVYAPDTTVIQQLEDGSNISDTNVIVTNLNYSEGAEEETTLNDTLNTISDDISRLQRNVSWLAEHGGGGGNSGGGGGASYGIVVVSPANVLNGGSVYADSTALTVVFMITGGTSNDPCSYYYQYDTETSQRVEDTVGKEVRVTLDLTKNSLKQHTFIIRATNMYGTAIAPLSFTIYRSSLSMWFDTGATTNYDNGIFNIMQNDGVASVPFVISNGLIGSTTTISVLRGTAVLKTYEFENKTSNDQKWVFSFWDIISNPVVNEQYVIYVDASARVGNIETYASRVQVRIKIINPSELTISFGVNGNAASNEPIEVELDSTMIYNFKTYAPLSISNVYYSAKIVKNGEEELILGKYYDEHLNIGGATYTENPYTEVEETIHSQYALSDMLYNERDSITLFIKAWGAGSNRVAEVSQELRIIESSSEIFPRQYPNRGGFEKGTMLASWNRKNVTDTNRNVWTSTVTDYVPINQETSVDERTITVNAEMNIINGNENSGLISTSAPRYLRLQNRAYGKISLENYMSEVDAVTTKRSNYGYTVSVTFQADDASNTDKTIFLWGTNTSTNDLLSGIRIDLDKVYWRPADEVMSCNISPGTKHTVDFVYDAVNKVAKIYVNGIMNVASSVRVDYLTSFPSDIYVGANYRNGTIERYADESVYEISIYTQKLNDIQLIVNGKNARLDGSESDSSVMADYRDWKIKNFFTGTTVDSYFFDSNTGDYRTSFSSTEIDYIKVNSNIPTITLSFNDGEGFTKDWFLSPHTGSETGFTNAKSATLGYFDNETRRDISGLNFKVTLQGTSTLKYRIKNLEIYTEDTVEIDGVSMPVLFQPKKTWFPEKQFTLKADVVDSSHANNAVIGEWINNSSLFENNPAMNAFMSNRTKEVDQTGAPRTHKIEGGTEYIDYDESVTIKHTLEGFPVLLFIHFDSQTDGYSFVGIYSFNLGRYSYYNTGLRFLECFSRGSSADAATPRLITYYKETDHLGSISVNDVKSFEFDNEANSSYAEHPTWTQYDAEIVSRLGKYRYPDLNTAEAKSDSSFGGLCSLFQSVATSQLRLDTSGGKFDGIYQYTAESNGDQIDYHQVGSEPIPQNTVNLPTIADKIDINNAVAYFIVANAFGMTDSLAKNLTLRTWDNGQKWYTCFYDMDTALGISNTGTEDTPVYVAIDKVNSDPVYGVSYERHDNINGLGYSGYMSKLWSVFRDNDFVYSITGSREEPDYYTRMWAMARMSGGDLSSSDKFCELMATRVETCGEIIYNCDYESKYVRTDGGTESSTSGGTESSTGFLHGTRVEYVKKWLKNHFYFLDGIFDPKGYSQIQGVYEDSPYLANTSLAVNVEYLNLTRIPLMVKSSTPSFIRVGIGASDGAGGVKFYIPVTDELQTIYINNSTSTNTALFINGSTLLTRIEGLSGAFKGMGQDNPAGSIRSLEVFDVSNSPSIQANGVGDAFLNSIRYNNESPLETVNLSNTTAPDTTCELRLDGLKKVLSIDISNSDVSTLTLPDSSLDYLNVENSKIGNLTLVNQNKLKSISTNGCDKLNQLTIQNCDSLENLQISEKAALDKVKVENNDLMTSITIDNCQYLSSVEIGGNSGLKEVVISNCPKLATIKLYDNTSLSSVEISECRDKNLSISVSGSELRSIKLSGIESDKVITLPTSESLKNLTTLQLNNFYEFGGFKYGDDPIEMYEGENGESTYVLDLSPFVNLQSNGIILRNVQSLKYVRVKNEQEDPFEITNSIFVGTTRGIVKIFGHIKITESPFGGMSDFYINHDPEYSDISTTSARFVTTEEDKYYTNVTLNSSSLSGWFSGTNCDINDVYYILMLCDENTRNLGDLFSGCNNVVTDDDVPIRPDTFVKCTGVNNIDGIFNGCNIGGTLSEPMIIEGEETSGNVLLNPLIGNLTTFSNVFSGDYKIATTENCFFPEGCAIKILKGFSPKSSDGGFLNDESLLSTLTELEVIESSFNEVTIDFGRGSYDATELFRNNTKLVSIKDSFVNIDGYGTIRNIFGEYSNEPEGTAYPSNLSAITHSFIFASGSHDEINGEDSGKIAFPIGNSLFKRIKNSITYIGGAYPGDNRTDDDYHENYVVNCGSFTGPGLLKYLANDEFYIQNADAYENDDCNGENFPYHIFDGCVKLKEITSLFESVVNLKGYNEGVESDIFVTIPGNMFDEAGSLTNISRMFKDMSSSINCTLTGEGFKNLSLINVDMVFNGISLNGQIPFKLFYEESENDYATNGVSGLTEAQATALEIVSDSGTIGRTLSESEYTVFSGKYKAINPTIRKMSSSLAGITSTNARHYTAVIGSIEDLTEDNPSYNPLKYILNGDSYTRNENFNPYKKIWNKFVFDNDVNFYVAVNEIISNLPTDEYGYPVVDTAEMPSEFTQAYIQEEVTPSLHKEYFGVDVDDSDIGLFEATNYFCPPDVLRYCRNDYTTDVSYVFANSSGQYNKDTHTISGYRGKIPTALFEPISELTAVTGTFSYNMGLFPYRWPSGDSTVAEMGTMYYPQLLYSIPNVATISGMFSGTKIWGHTKIPSDFLNGTTKITNLSYLWSGCEWVSGNSETIANQVMPTSIFYGLSRLTDVSFTLAGNGTTSVPFITSNILSRTQNGSVNNVSGFMQNATRTRGTVPQFWDWSPEPRSHEGTYRAGADSYIQQVSNADAIAANGTYWRAT